MRARPTALLLIAAAALVAAPSGGAQARRLDVRAHERLLPDEVLVEVDNSLRPAEIRALQRRHRLAGGAALRLTLSGTTLLRWRIPDRRPVATVLRALAREAAVLSAQPNHRFTLR